MTRNRGLVLTVALILGAVVGIQIWPYLRGPQYQGRYIPPQGLVVFPNAGTPGNGEEAVQDFRKIYAAMDKFRRERGRLPEPSELMPLDRKTSPAGLSPLDFQTPDRKSREGYREGDQSGEYAFNYLIPRPDGKKKPAFPAPGEKDVWLFCDTYARGNHKVFRDRHSEFKPEGAYVVLWSDGTIAKIPVKDVLWIGNPQNGAEMNFAGQTGVPRVGDGGALVRTNQQRFASGPNRLMP